MRHGKRNRPRRGRARKGRKLENLPSIGASTTWLGPFTSPLIASLGNSARTSRRSPRPTLPLSPLQPPRPSTLISLPSWPPWPTWIRTNDGSLRHTCITCKSRVWRDHWTQGNILQLTFYSTSFHSCSTTSSTSSFPKIPCLSASWKRQLPRRRHGNSAGILTMLVPRDSSVSRNRRRKWLAKKFKTKQSSTRSRKAPLLPRAGIFRRLQGWLLRRG